MSTSQVTFATDMSEPTLFGKTADDEDGGKKKHEDKDKDCLCGRKHRFEKCYYLIPNLAPPTWKEDPEIRTKIDSLLKKSKRLAQAVERAVKRANVTAEPAGTGNHDANYADADAEPENRHEVALLAYVDPDVIPRPHTHLLLPQATEHPSVQSFLNSADPILNLNIAALSGQRFYELRDSWILDNGSNAHVSNIRERFETFTPIEGKSFKTGDSYTQMVGYGTTYAIRTDDNGNRIITRLAETIYAPGFHTNIISGTRLRRAGILNNEHDFQLQRKGSRECFATYKEIHDMLVIEYNPIGTIKRTDESLPEPSSQNQQDENTIKNVTFATTERSEEPRLMQQLIEQPEEELQQVKELVEIINIEWMTLPDAQPMDESLYEESRLMQQIVEQPEQLEPGPEDGRTEPKEAEQAGLPTPETTPAPEMNLIHTMPTEAERAERARSTLEAERPRGWTAVSADLRTDHIIDDKRPRKPPDRRAVY